MSKESVRDGTPKSITHAVGSRVALIGNPSDGFGGKTLAVLMENFYASASLSESCELRIIPHPKFDPFTFADLQHLARSAAQDGYYGGMRLLYATCKRFCSYCQEHNIDLPNRAFTIEYDSNIPRQVGLAGSSAIVTAALKCLMDFYELGEEHIPLPLQPQLVLSVETDELNIQAGLQDRVTQVYGGLVYMDFDPEYMGEHGHGYYERLPLDLLPPLYVAYLPHSGRCSGKMHNRMRYRYQNRDQDVISAMKEFAQYTDLGVEALKAGDINNFAELINKNFDLRRRLYGEQAIDEESLRMIELARGLGLPAKFPGSGGAVVGLYQDHAHIEKVRQAFEEHGYGFALVRPTQKVV